MDFGQPIKLGGSAMCRIHGLYRFSSIPYSLFIFLSIVVSLALSLLVGSLPMAL